MNTQEFGTLKWPLGWKRSQHRTQSRFSQSRSYSASAQEIRIEVKRLGGRDLAVTSNLRLRGDGLPYADQRRPDDPGVAIYFKLDGEPVVFACDAYVRPEDNLYAIAKTIEAKRGILRWGCATGVREFTGYAALPETIQAGRAAYDPPIREVLGVAADAQLDDVREAYRKWVLAAHPDNGGDAERFVRIKATAERLIQELTPP